MVDDIVWCSRGYYPVFIGFCPNQAAWDKEMDRLNSNFPYPDKDGCVTCFEGPHKERVLIVTIGEQLGKRDRLSIESVMVHECVHLWQFICQKINEDQAGWEITAYSIQWLFIHMMTAYDQTRTNRKHKNMELTKVPLHAAS